MLPIVDPPRAWLGVGEQLRLSLSPFLRGCADAQPTYRAPPALLAAAGVKLGENYPWRLVDHPIARQRALDAYEQIKQVV